MILADFFRQICQKIVSLTLSRFSIHENKSTRKFCHAFEDFKYQIRANCNDSVIRSVILQNVVRFLLVHKLEPKKRVFGCGGWTRYNIDF